jgi:hypothetical protein
VWFGASAGPHSICCLACGLAVSRSERLQSGGSLLLVGSGAMVQSSLSLWGCTWLIRAHLTAVSDWLSAPQVVATASQPTPTTATVRFSILAGDDSFCMQRLHPFTSVSAVRSSGTLWLATKTMFTPTPCRIGSWHTSAKGARGRIAK